MPNNFIQENFSARSKIGLVLLSLATLVSVYFGWRLFWFLTDDAFIAFRYVSNSYLGYGYVWNAAPFRPVEGYTSFLWVVLLDLIWRLTGLEPPESANYLSLFFVYLTLFLGALMVLGMNLNERLRRFKVLLLALIFVGVISNRTFLAWTSSGLETSMFNFSLTLWIYCTLFFPSNSRRWVLGLTLSASLVTLTRPDGLLFAVISLGLVGNAVVRQWRSSRSSAFRLALAATPLLIIPVHLVWRHAFYGEWLPNTYFAKNIGGRIWLASGIRYFLSFMIEYSFWVWVALLIVVIVARVKNRKIVENLFQVSSARLAVCTAILGHLLYYTIIIGGDHFEYRVYSHLILLAFISFLWMLNALRVNLKYAVVLLFVFLTLSWPIPWLHWAATHNLEGRQRTVILRASVAKEAQRDFPLIPNFLLSYLRAFDDMQFWLIGHLVCIRHQEHKNFYIDLISTLPSRAEGMALPVTDYPTLATKSVGVISWVAPRVNIIDLYGLNDYVIARNPDIYRTMNMAHERKPPPGYEKCFAPNVDISDGHFMVNPRAIGLTVELIERCEKKYAEIVKDSGQTNPEVDSRVENPIDDPLFFVRQQYKDVLNREADPSGLVNWYETLKPCQTDSDCFNRERRNIPVQFFNADEFQQKAFFVYRLYSAAYGRVPSFLELMNDQNILKAYPVDDWRDPLDFLPAQRSLLEAWVQRSSFREAYPQSMTSEAFINRLFDNAGLKPFNSERLKRIDEMQRGKSRAEVLRELTELPEFKQRENDRGVVLMQLLIQLRRDLDPQQEIYRPWIEMLNRGEKVDFRQFICIVLTSEEYQRRFSPNVTHDNSQCH